MQASWMRAGKTDLTVSATALQPRRRLKADNLKADSARNDIDTDVDNDSNIDVGPTSADDLNADLAAPLTSMRPRLTSTTWMRASQMTMASMQSQHRLDSTGRLGMGLVAWQHRRTQCRLGDTVRAWCRLNGIDVTSSDDYGLDMGLVMWSASMQASWTRVGKANLNDLEVNLPDDSSLEGALTDADSLETDLANADGLNAGLADVGRKDSLNGFGDSSTASTWTQGGRPRGGLSSLDMVSARNDIDTDADDDNNIDVGPAAAVDLDADLTGTSDLDVTSADIKDLDAGLTDDNGLDATSAQAQQHWQTRHGPGSLAAWADSVRTQRLGSTGRLSKTRRLSAGSRGLNSIDTTLTYD